MYSYSFFILSSTAVWSCMTYLLISVSKLIFKTNFTVGLQNSLLLSKIYTGELLLSFLSTIKVSQLWGCS